MQKLIVPLLLSLTIYELSFAQSAHIRGNIVDTIEKKSLSNAVVLLFSKSDSIMVKFARTDKAGSFTLRNLPAGKFVFIISYPSYADYTDEIELKDSSEVDLHKIRMIQKAQLLQEVVVSGNKGAIHIKGDTLEFKADSFFVRKDATVEDLLKRLPGIQVDKNGKITAQGEAVQKVLVDGEEFFGDDPTLVTQNLRADMVDKVQVFDKKSDQATFTGIDDGQKSKTINLKLKDDKKNGYFGKINAGIGNNGYYDNQAMINMFKKKEKIGVYGILSNTGKTGLNWQENNRYGESFANNVEYDEMMGYFSFSGQNDELDTWNGQYNGQGYPKVQTAGIHYNNKWGDDKQTINGNYKILQLQVTGNSSTTSQYILPDTTYYINQSQSFDNRILRNRASASYEMKFDTSSSLKITANGGTDHKITHGVYHSEARATDSTLVNQSNRSISDISNTQTLNSNILWRKKLPKKGRTLSVNVLENYTGSTSGGFLYANNNFYGKGGLTQNQLTDQYKNYQNQNQLLDTKVTYSEPLSAVSALVANYGFSINNSNSNRNSYNKTPGGKYSSLDSLYSNDYQFNVFTQRGGLAYNLSKKNLRLNAGSNVGFSKFIQKDLHQNNSTQRSFVNWYPRASLSYSFTQQRRLVLSYDGNTTQPTIQQIQPIHTNEDPLNVSIGNPNLKPQYSNNIRFYFYDYKVFTERNIYANLSYNSIQDAIGTKDNIDSTGKKLYQAVNLNGNSSLNGYFGYGFKVKKPGVNLDFNINISQNRFVSIVNDHPNITQSGNYSGGFNLYKNKEKKYSISINSSATYTSSVSSINTGITTRYWSFNLRPETEVFLPLKFQIHSDCDFNFRQKTSLFDRNTNAIFWNAWIGKKFIKNDALMLKVSVNDLLNQNIGFDRSVNSNYISQNTYNTIQRFYLVSIVWNFNKAGTPAPE